MNTLIYQGVQNFESNVVNKYCIIYFETIVSYILEIMFYNRKNSYKRGMY